MNNTNFETERKFLTEFPIDFSLANIVSKSEIEQIYLKDSETRKNTRIRKRVYESKEEYTLTSKIHITNMTRLENEKNISKSEYENLKKEADLNLHTIYKIRYVIEYKEQLFELDVYDFWENYAVLEIEMQNEHTKIEFPEYIKIICELTDDKSFTNHSIALKIPDIDKYTQII